MRMLILVGLLLALVACIPSSAEEQQPLSTVSPDVGLRTLLTHACEQVIERTEWLDDKLALGDFRNAQYRVELHVELFLICFEYLEGRLEGD